MCCNNNGLSLGKATNKHCYSSLWMPVDATEPYKSVFTPGLEKAAGNFECISFKCGYFFLILKHFQDGFFNASRVAQVQL